MKKRGALFLGLLSLMNIPTDAVAMTREEIDGFLGKLGADNQYDPVKALTGACCRGRFIPLS